MQFIKMKHQFYEQKGVVYLSKLTDEEYENKKKDFDYFRYSISHCKERQEFLLNELMSVRYDLKGYEEQYNIVKEEIMREDLYREIKKESD